MKQDLEFNSEKSTDKHQNDWYKNVLTEALVPMTIRIGCIHGNSIADLPFDVKESVTSTKIMQAIAACMSGLTNQPIATSIYSKNQPVMRLVSNQKMNVSSADGVQIENLIIDSVVEKKQDINSIQQSEILFSTEVFDIESQPDFILNQIASQSDLLIIDDSSPNIEQFILNILASNESPCLVIIRGDESFDFAQSDSTKTTRKLNESQLFSNLELELNEILLFDSLLKTNAEEHDSSNAIDAVQTKEAVLRIVDYANESSLEVQDIESDFEYQGPIASSGTWISWHNVFRNFVSFLSPKTTKKEIQAKLKETVKGNLDAQKSSENCHKLFAQFLRADLLAIRYANAHRSSFILIYCLGAFALINAAIAIGFSQIGWLALTSALTEFFALVGIFILYRNDHKKHYHIKWLEYRSLAEMLRMAPLLNSIGITQSARGFERHRKHHDPELADKHNTGRTWLIIYTESLMRWIDFDRVKINYGTLLSAKQFLRETILKSQIKYHQNNAHKMQIVGHNLGHFSYILFVLAFIFVSGKLLTKFLSAMHLGIDYELLSHAGHGLGVLAAVCPMIGSAAFAIRNHAEFDISSQRSLAMLKNLKTDIEALDEMSEPTKYSELVEQTIKTSLTMQSETADWLEIYEVKETEPG